MKKISSAGVLFIILALISVNVLAQSQDTTRRRGARIEELKSKLALNKVQTEMVDSLFKKFQSEMTEIRENNSLERTERMQQIRELSEKLDMDIEEILNDEQKEKFQEIKKERLNRMMQGQGRNNPN